MKHGLAVGVYMLGAAIIWSGSIVVADHRNGKALGATTQGSLGGGSAPSKVPVRSNGYLLCNGRVGWFESEYWGEANPEIDHVALPGGAPHPWLDTERKLATATTFDQMLKFYTPASQASLVADRGRYEKMLAAPKAPGKKGVREDIVLVVDVHFRDAERIFLATQIEDPPKPLGAPFSVIVFEKANGVYLVDDTEDNTMLVTGLSSGRLGQFGGPSFEDADEKGDTEDVVFSLDSIPPPATQASQRH
jgi:hypothetical protein